MNFLFPSRAPKVPAATTLVIDDAPVEITVKVSPRAKSYRLTVPHHGNYSAARTGSRSTQPIQPSLDCSRN